MTKLTFLLDIQDCIDERIENLALRLNLDKNKVKGNYVHRVNMLQAAHQYKSVQDAYSHLMAKAWEGTVRYYESKVQ